MTEKRHYVDTSSSSFYGEYLYEQIVTKDHFLRKLKEIIDWEYFTKRLIKLYKGQGMVGRPPFDPALVLKKEIWQELVKTSHYQEGRKVRFMIERKFGEAKQGHGLALCRYIGKARFAFQAFFTAIVLNLKRMVKVLQGVNFKARAYAAE